MPSSSLSGVSSLILFALFATGVNDTSVVDTGGNLPPVSLTPAANLPPVSLSPVANLPPVSLTPAANLPPVSLSQVENLPPVSTTLVKLVEKFAAGVVDTGGAP